MRRRAQLPGPRSGRLVCKWRGLPGGLSHGLFHRLGGGLINSVCRGLSLIASGDCRRAGGRAPHRGMGAAGAGAPLGGLIAQCAAERLSGEFDTVTWVPVSRRRLRQRGYDQAELLARGACRRWDTVPERLLEKIRDNPAQSALSDGAVRWENVRDVYRAAPPEAVRGRRVLLVDDICTTGATLSECAKVLAEAGAETVVCAAAARTPLGG